MPQFDFGTITDVVLHVRFTAREGGEMLKTAAVSSLQALIKNAQTVGSVCLFSIRREFPTPWAKFQNATITGATPTAELQLTLVPELYPFWAQAVVGGSPAKPVVIKGIEFFAQISPGEATATVHINDKADQSGNDDTLVRNPLLGNLMTGALSKIPLPAAITNATHPALTLYLNDNSIEDLWMAITWGT